ncbi:hypothetical protein V6N12_014097 [Hibiscus sabdariffa]|uniref:Uncharacterized protein n=1 Tax=Hibiscus sabdariffa TaxID=183260 RepID=A0ABR2CYP6_9ROSI
MAQLLFVARCVGLSYRFGLLLNRVTRAWTSETGSRDPYPGASSSLDPRAFVGHKDLKGVLGGLDGEGMFRMKLMGDDTGGLWANGRWWKGDEDLFERKWFQKGEKCWSGSGLMNGDEQGEQVSVY